jgi:excinuclease UvrABC nuclease subunit
MENKAVWLGYSFEILTPEADWNPIAGIYIFCGKNRENIWTPFYIGQASSFSERLSGHDRWEEAVNLGATHIHAKVVKNQTDRHTIETKLIQSLQPRLNTQLR